MIEVPAFQDLLHFICENGFEHHVAINPTPVADVLYEAIDKYLGWDVYYHQGVDVHHRDTKTRRTKREATPNWGGLF